MLLLLIFKIQRSLCFMLMELIIIWNTKLLRLIWRYWLVCSRSINKTICIYVCDKLFWVLLLLLLQESFLKKTAPRWFINTTIVIVMGYSTSNFLFINSNTRWNWLVPCILLLLLLLLMLMLLSMLLVVIACKSTLWIELSSICIEIILRKQRSIWSCCYVLIIFADN